MTRNLVGSVLVRFVLLSTWISRLDISNLAHDFDSFARAGLYPTTQNFDLLYFLISGRAGVVIGHDRNHVGPARASLNPDAHDINFFIFFSSFSGHGYCMTRMRTRLEILNLTPQNFDLLYFLISGHVGVVIGHD